VTIDVMKKVQRQTLLAVYSAVLFAFACSAFAQGAGGGGGGTGGRVVVADRAAALWLRRNCSYSLVDYFPDGVA
jgi:hypothetical protein